MSERILIAGCGRIGTRLGVTLAEQGHAVYGLRRSPGELPAGIAPVTADLLGTGLPAALPRALDRVYYILTPSRYDDDGYRAAYVDGLGRLLEALAMTGSDTARLLFVSSTGVYGQEDGSWVDETSPTTPGRFSGRRLLEAEGLVRQHAGRSIAVRFAGIYGAGRNALIRRVREGAPCSDHPPRYTNRIHEDDCIGILAHLGALADPDPVYIGVDSHPCAQCEIMDWLAAELGCPPPARTSGGSAGRRCRNDRLLATGYQLRHPDYRSGYREALSRTGVRKAGSSDP